MEGASRRDVETLEKGSWNPGRVGRTAREQDAVWIELPLQLVQEKFRPGGEGCAGMRFACDRGVTKPTQVSLQILDDPSEFRQPFPQVRRREAH
jgi:hypothetical protein